MTVLTNVTKEQLTLLTKLGFSVEPNKTIHEKLRLKKANTTIILYISGKLLIQGKNATEAAKLLRKLKIGIESKPEQFKPETGWVIGSDEVLKGDTFGGIVVAAVKADSSGREKLNQLGIADSKTLTDKEILPMAEKIKQIVACEIKSLLPEEYNSKEGNVTDLLNKLHQQAAQELQPGKHIVDKYPGCVVGDIAVEKAESKYIEVAAASVLARAAGLQQLDYLGLQAGFTIPKGSTHVSLALHELQARKLDFKKFVKMDFRNVIKFLEDEGR